MRVHSRNRLFFGLGTVGRDMLYTTVSMFLMFYLTDILNLDDGMMWWMTLLLTVFRVFDALNDPIMGLVVDNTDSPWGKFKPAMLVGALGGALFMVLMFTDLGLTGAQYLLFFFFCHLMWDVFYGANDIAYWSMLPALSLNRKERERAGAFARICANIGMYLVVVGIMPATKALTDMVGDARRAWLVFAMGTAVLMVLFQLFTVLGVREQRETFKKERKTSLKDMLTAILKNDQLLYNTLAMALFMIGYTTTTSFGLHFFKYAYGDEDMYGVFALVLGVAQLTALGVFPLFSKRYERKTLYRGATALVVLGYLVFFFSPMHMLPIAAAGLLLFLGQAFIQLLMLVFLADTIEYGQWKLGRRNEAVTFSLQPLINKLGGAVSSGIVGATLILSGINRAESAADVTAEGVTLLKVSMLLLPLVCIVLGYMVYARKYRIDAKFHARIVEELQQRGALAPGEDT